VGTRSTNATINGVYDATIDSPGTCRQAQQKEVTVRRRCSRCRTRGTMQPGHYIRQTWSTAPETTQFVPHGRLQSRLSRYRWTMRFCRVAVPRPPRRRPFVERDVSSKKPNNRVPICSSNGAGCLGRRRGPVRRPARLRQFRWDSAPRKVQMAWTRTVGGYAGRSTTLRCRTRKRLRSFQPGTSR